MKRTAFILSLLLAVSLLSSCAPKGSSGDSNPNSNSEVTVSSNTDTDALPISSEVTAPTPPSINEPDFQLPDSNNITSTRYGYYTLSADEKMVYDQIVDAATRFVPVVKLKRQLPTDVVSKICQIIYLEENELYYARYEKVYNKDTELTHTVELTFSLDKEEVVRQATAVNERITQIIDKIQPWMAIIDIMKLFHDEVIVNCQYSLEGEHKASPYGALVDGSALCEGYARAFAMLCNRYGIENLIATGTAKRDGAPDEEHMWNMVKVQGYWYNMDLTWDDPVSAPENNLPPFDSDFVWYSYFLYPTYMLEGKMVLHDEFYTLPEATSMNLNYFIYYGNYARTYDECVEILGKKLYRAFDKKQKYVSIKLSSKALYDEAVENLFGPKQEIGSSLLTPGELKRGRIVRSPETQSFLVILIYNE